MRNRCPRRPRAILVVVLLATLAGTTPAVEFDGPHVSPMGGPGAGDRLVAADLNGDCAPDLLSSRDTTVAAEDPSLNLLIGDALGTFPDGASINGGFKVSGIAVGDLDRDGVAEIVTTENFNTLGFASPLCGSTRPRVPVLRDDGLGGYALIECLVARNHPSGVVIGDFFEDDVLDLVVINAPKSSQGATNPEVLFFRGRGDGTFFTSTVLFDRRAWDVVAADFNGDGHLDLFLGGEFGSYVAHGSGFGTFVPAPGSITGKAVRVATGDIDGDGWTDVAAVAAGAFEPGSNTLWVAINDGAGGFGSPTSYVTGLRPAAVVVEDLDRDGYADVVVANHEDDDVRVYAGSASGALGAAQVFPAGTDPMALAVGDWNGDGYADLAVANRNSLPGGSLDDGSVSSLIQVMATPLEVATTALPSGRLTEPYGQCLRARGGTPPYVWSVATGTLPPGLGLDPDFGLLSGTPTAEGSYPFTVQVEDAVPDSATGGLTLEVLGAHAAPPSGASDPAWSHAGMIVTAIDPATGDVTIQYEPACGATDHAVHAGALSSVSTSCWDLTTCGLGTSGQAVVALGAGDRFFVIAGRNGSWEGSLGTDSAGAERTAPSKASGCWVPQQLGGTCP